MFKNLLTISMAIMIIILSSTASAETDQAVPKLIRIVVPFGAGASTDMIARATASQLADRLKTNVIVENKPGASTMIGVDTVTRAPKDGSVLLLTTPSTVTAAATMKNKTFDFNKDLVPIANLGEGPMVIVASINSGVKTPQDLVAKAKAKPDSMTYGTSGIGTLAHMTYEMISDASSIHMMHVPYKGSSYTALDLSSGLIDLSVGVNSSYAAQIKSGKVRAVAVTSHTPSPAFPDLPAMASAAPGFSVDIWAVVFAPAGTDPKMASLLNRELNEISKSNELRELMKVDGAAPKPSSLEQLQESMRNSYDQWKKLAADKKIMIK